MLFRPAVDRGLQGAWIVTSFKKYNDFPAAARAHVTSGWHRDSMTKFDSFVSVMNKSSLSVGHQLDSALHKQIESNRNKLLPIVKTLLLCATHDLPVRGKTEERSLFSALLKFRVDSGDQVLKDHFETAAGNAKYTSVRTQNELMCEFVLKHYARISLSM